MVVTNINQERYDALILQMPAKPLPSCDKVIVGCVVPLRTYCKNLLNKANEELHATAEALYGRTHDSSDHYLGMN